MCKFKEKCQNAKNHEDIVQFLESIVKRQSHPLGPTNMTLTVTSFSLIVTDLTLTEDLMR